MKHTINKVKKILHNAFEQKQSMHTLALSLCIGNYIAFSPFIGLHTVMVLVSVWLFNLNMPITFAIAYGVNNPWTAIPVYALDYLIGYWIVHDIAVLELQNPSWMAWIEYFIQNNLNLPKPCLWSFLIGGNVLGILTSIVAYPIALKLFTFLAREKRIIANQ